MVLVKEWNAKHHHFSSQMCQPCQTQSKSVTVSIVPDILKEMAALNPSLKKILVASTPPDNVDTKEAIVGAFDTGFSLDDGISTNANCDETTVTDVSGDIAVDDLFVVFANDTYYLLRVDEVNASGGDNADNIVFSIKY